MILPFSKKHISLRLALLFFLAAPSLLAQWVPVNPVDAVEPQPDGAVLVLKTGFLRFQVCSDSIVHVVYSLERNVPQRSDLIIVKKSWPKSDFSVNSDDPKVITLVTPRLKIEITRADSSIVFLDSEGHHLAQENTHTLTPTEVNGEKTYHSERFVNMWDTQEAFYGLGQHQAGVWNYRGEAVDLSQDNTNISIPVPPLQQRLRHFLEQRLAQPLQQPFRPRLLSQLRSLRFHRLLLSSTAPTSTASSAAIANLPAPFLSSANGPTATGNAKTAMTHSRSFSPSPKNIATCTSPSTTSSRIGFGGTSWAIPSSTKIIPIPKAWSTRSTMTTSIS